MPKPCTPQEQIARKVAAIGEYLRYLRADLDASLDLDRALEMLADLEVLRWKTQDTIDTLAGLARYQGHTWAEIAHSLGVTKQAAQQRYGES